MSQTDWTSISLTKDTVRLLRRTSHRLQDKENRTITLSEFVTRAVNALIKLELSDSGKA